MSFWTTELPSSSWRYSSGSSAGYPSPVGTGSSTPTARPYPDSASPPLPLPSTRTLSHHLSAPDQNYRFDSLGHLMEMANPTKKAKTAEEESAKPIELQRRRVFRACQLCRRKKIKCDGTEPVCSQCTSSGAECTWLQTKDRAALSRHYVQELEARLLHMESLFSQITPVLEQLGPLEGLDMAGSSASGPAFSSEQIASLVQAAKAVAPSSSSPEAAVKSEDDMSETFGQLALDEHGQARWIGGSSTMSLIQSFRTLTSSPLHRISPMEDDGAGPSATKLYFPASVFFGKVHALPGAEEVEYPERDLADKLVNTYFERFHFLMPVIDKPSFMLQYTRVMDSVHHDSSLARKEAAFISLVFAVFACAAHLVDDPRLSSGGSQDDGGIGMVYYERALILHYISHATIQLSHVQCFVLMSSFLCSVNCLPQAWIMVGQAVRTSQDLGLHRSPRRLLISNIEKETRRKIWWCAYSLDRMLAFALGRPLGAEDSDCDVELPVEVDDEQLPDYFAGATLPQGQPSLMAGAIALATLYKIGGRVLREVYAIENTRETLEPERKAQIQRTVEAIDQELTTWCDNLPAAFKNESVTEKQVSMGAVLCSHYYSVLTTLHRNFLPVSRREQPIAPKSTAKAVSSARSCIRLAPSIRNVVPPSHHLAFFIQHLFSSAVILLLYAMHATDPRATAAAMEEAKTCLGALESWEGQWPGAKKCRELLTDLTTTASEAIAANAAEESAAATASPPSAVSLERRRSNNEASSSAGGRVVKAKPKRTQSRDPNTTFRRPLAIAGPSTTFRSDARTRSTSRKRGHDEPDNTERSGGRMSAYGNSYTSPTTSRVNTSPHSSPASANMPSPAMSVAPEGETSPGPLPTQTYTYNNVPISPLHPVPFDYDFTMQQSINQHPYWNGADSSMSSAYPSVPSQQHPQQLSSQQQPSPMFYPTHSPRSSLDANTNYMFNPSQDMMQTPAGYTTPPTSFDLPGLPFPGYDYLRNYPAQGYTQTVGGQDALWQTFDPNNFGYDPELPFTVGGDNEGRGNGHGHHLSQ